MTKTLFFFVLLPFLLNCLRISSHEIDALFSSAEYKKELKNVQNSFEYSIDDLTRQINDIQKIIDDQSTVKRVKIQKITEKMADERDSLY